METSARLLRLLSLLQSRRDWSSLELADRLGVTTRTVRNDVERLRQLGYPVDAMRGRGGGYWLGTGATIPPLLLEDDEAVALVVALRTIAGASVAGFDDTAIRALAKIQQLLPSRLRRKVSALEGFLVPVPSPGRTVSIEILILITTACRDRQRLRFSYQSHEGATSRRDVEPHRLVNDGQRWYLLAWDIARSGWRTFRVDRMTVPKIHPGPKFSPRNPPHGYAATHVAKSTGTAMWKYRAVVTAKAPAETLLARLPPAVQVDPIDERSCRLHVGSSTPQMLALYLGMLDVDFELDDADSHPELIDHLRTLSNRYRAAAQ